MTTIARAKPAQKSVDNSFSARGPSAASKRESTPVDAIQPNKRQVGTTFQAITTKKDPNDG